MLTVTGLTGEKVVWKREEDRTCSTGDGGVMSGSGEGAEARWLPWLADAPMFIDGKQVADFYDSVLRPSFKTVQMEFAEQRLEQLKKSLSGQVGVNLPAWFPWLKLDVGGGGSREKTTSENESQKITLEPIENPSRQLVEIALHYLENQPTRVWFHEGNDWNLPEVDDILRTPRMLAFIDFPPKTQFQPMAGELNNGKVRTFFDVLVGKLKRPGETLPVSYPDDPYTEQGRQDLKDYWDWFRKYWNANKAVQVIEDVIGDGGRPRWIDYRVPVGETTLHLHVVGHGEFDTGVFAYNLVKRGSKHGLRVVGSMKSEPDLNVLAIYEK